MAKAQSATLTIAPKGDHAPTPRAGARVKGAKISKGGFGDVLNRARSSRKRGGALRSGMIKKGEKTIAAALGTKNPKPAPNPARTDMPLPNLSVDPDEHDEKTVAAGAKGSELLKRGMPRILPDDETAAKESASLAPVANDSERRVASGKAARGKTAGAAPGITERNDARSIPTILAAAEVDSPIREGRVEVVDRRRHPVVDIKSLRADTRRSKKGNTEAVIFRTASAGGTVEEAKTAVLETEIGTTERGGVRRSDSNMAADLARRLDAEAGSDIVRQVKVVLNQADSGEIRINLRPEHLGRVRVRIRMEDNRLSGRIFVESAAAREAFRSALDGLQIKLVESGFGAADLDLAWDERGMADPRSDERFRREPGNRESAVNEFESMSALTVEETDGDGRINMVI